MSWQDNALCVGRSDIDWFPGSGGAGYDNLKRARAVCAACPVSRACLADVLSRPAEAGIWAGTTENQRRGMVRVRRREAVALCGTAAGYNRHRNAGESPCRDCLDAHATAERERKRRRRGVAL